MIPAPKESSHLLKQGKGVFLIETSMRASRSAPVEIIYTVTASWAPTRFYRGNDLNAAEAIFGQAVARAPQRAR